MAGPIGNSGVKVTGGGGTPAYGKALALLATLFFMWGFITVINNTLLPHLRSVFDLSYTQTTLIESVWFIAYAVDPVSVPDKACRLQARNHHRAGHHGRWRAGYGSGGAHSIL